MDKLIPDIVGLIHGFLKEREWTEAVHALESASGYYFDIAYAKELFVASDFVTLKKYLRGFLSVDHGSDHQIILFDILKEYFFEAVHRKEYGAALKLLKDDFAFVKSEPIYESLKKILYESFTQDLDKIDDNLKSWRDTSKYREALWNQKIEKGLMRVLADQLRPVNVPEGRLKTLLNHSLNYQHNLCKPKSDTPQNYIWTLFEDHRCGYKAPDDVLPPRKINGVGHKPEILANSSVASKEEASEKSEKSEKRVEASPTQQRAAATGQQQEKLANNTNNTSVNNTPNSQSSKSNGVSPSSSNGTTAATPSGTTKLKRSATTPVDDGPKKKKARVAKPEDEEEEDVLPVRLLTTLKFRDCKVVAAKFNPKYDHILIVCINSMSGGSITLIDLKVGHEYCAAHKKPIAALDFSKDGRFFAVSYIDDNAIDLFRFKSENEFAEARTIVHDANVQKFAFVDAYLTDGKDSDYKISRSKGHKTMIISADVDGNAFGWDAVTAKLEHKYEIPEGHDITAIGEFVTQQGDSEYQFLLLASKHNVAFCCRTLSSELAVPEPLGLPSENGVCDFVTVATRVFSVGTGPRSLVEWDYTSTDMKKAEFKEFRKTSKEPVAMSAYQNLLAVPDDKVIKFYQITDYTVIARVSEELTQNRLVLAVNFNKLGQLLAATLDNDSVVILANSEAQTHFKIPNAVTFDDSGRVDSGKRRSSTNVPPPAGAKKATGADSARKTGGKLPSHDDEMLVDSGDETQGHDEMEVEKSSSQQSQSRGSGSQGSQGPLSKALQKSSATSTPTKSAVPVPQTSTPTPTPTPAPTPVVPRIIPVRNFRKLLLPDTPTAAIRAVRFSWNENMLFAMAANGHHKVWFHPAEKLTLDSQPGFSFFEDPNLRCNAEYPALAITNSDAFTLTNAEGDLRLLQVKDKKTLGFKARLYTPPADFGLTVYAMCPQDNNLLLLGTKKGELYRFNSHVNKPELKTAILNDGVQTYEITAIAFAPIYKLSSYYALAGSKDGKVSAWRMVKENDMYEFKRHTQAVLDGEGDVRITVFTPPGVFGESRQLDETRVLMSRNNYVVICKRDLTLVAKYKHREDLAPIKFAAWSAQGTHIYLCLRDDNILVLDKTLTIQRMITLHDDTISDITCMTASLHNNTMLCIGTATGKTLLIDLLN